MGISSRNGQTQVRVWAPKARSVEIMGDFNGWKATAAERLTLDPSSGIWSTTLNRSRPKGSYQFLINGQLAKRDPYARAVTPDGLRSLFYDGGEFKWENDKPLPQNPEDLVIYEMHVGTFNDPNAKDGKPATFYDAIKRLGQVAELGVNCVELMPVHEFNGMHSWGYNPCDLFAVEQAYGGPDGLKTFVKAAHRLGLAVHLDIVHNHYGPENLDLLRFDGTGGERSGGIYFYDGTGIDMTPWGPRVRFDEPMARRFVRDNAILWLEEYHIDGFRWDSTVNIRAYNMGSAAIPAGAKMLEDINSEIRSRFPERLSLAEDSLDIGNFHGSWDYDFHHSVMGVLGAKTDEAREMSMLSGAIGSQPTMRRVVYVDNHDEAGKINRQFRIATDVDPEHPNSDLARRLCGLGALFTFTSPGIPLLFMGNEMQEDGAFHDDRPLDWSKRVRFSGMVALHRDLIRLRRNLDGAGNALKGRGVEIPVADNKMKHIVYWRWHESAPDQKMVISANLSAQPLEKAVIPFPSPGPWKLLLDTESARYGGGITQMKTTPFQLKGESLRAQTRLAPYSARIYGLAAGASAEKAETVAAVALPKPESNPAAFSMYASIHVVGSFNDNNLTNQPLQLIANYEWQGRVSVSNAENLTFKLSANDDGRVNWGGYPDQQIEIPFRGEISRLGKPITIPGKFSGVLTFRFKEESMELSIESAPAAGN